MDYKKHEAKEYAKQHFRGIWAANLTPFNEDLSVNEAGFQKNLKHWIETLKLGGLFINGKMGEFFSMSLAERKQQFMLRKVLASAAASGERASSPLAPIPI
jgi:4-hydroxy-tetrahydrodipicolinate synthase